MRAGRFIATLLVVAGWTGLLVGCAAADEAGAESDVADSAGDEWGGRRDFCCEVCTFDAECGDGDDCTVDVCEPDGTCSHHDDPWCEPWCECEGNEICDSETGECHEATCENAGLPGCSCTTNEDCSSYLCAGVCLDTCVDECADENSRCTFVVVGGEPAYYCIPRFATLCRPCHTDADCKAAVGTDHDLCVTHGPAGSFCGAECSDDLPCPDGYACSDAAGTDGPIAKQCVLVVGECACSDRLVDLGADTACFVENAHGLCPGQRTCAAEGLTACDAKVPAAETCNGQDDDCDGATDEELGGEACENTNAFGTCAGAMACLDGALACAGLEPRKEECDLLDNNCNGQTDEGFPDADQDGTPDCAECDDCEPREGGPYDNCPGVSNPDQKNWDKDNLGGVLGDNKGDACDEDDDNDGVNDGDDCDPKNFEVYPGAPEKCDGKDNNCDMLVDEGFANTDGDALADCVDPDLDNDGRLNEGDNCPLVWNPAQTDSDGDGVGDACP